MVQKISGVPIAGQYVDRGDNSSSDLAHGAMTLDSTWVAWDMSSVVPAGAIAVELAIQFVTGNIDKLLSFRKNGNSNDKNALERKCLVAAVTHLFGGKVSCDVNRVIEYFATNPAPGAWDNIEINIRGWYF
jgi:hypothetical protein